MNLIEAAILGIIQGLTEFLPVSSSGHLVLGGVLLALTEPHILFDVIVHAATLVATLAFYRDTVKAMVSEALTLGFGVFDSQHWKNGFQAFPEVRLLLMIVLGSVPTACIGLIFKDELEALFGEPRFAAWMLLVTAGLLALTMIQRGSSRTIDAMTWRDALAIGLIQGMAVIPGISRSGSTIACAMLLGLDRQLAARYSFLLSVPAILGAVLLKTKDAVEAGVHVDVLPLVVGFFSAALVGILALRFFIPIVKQGKLHYFVAYLIPVGILGICVL
jgi:undecaprenyl-diphosphatase